jgi:hypothetical protein
MKYLENYKDFVGQGIYHIVTVIDNDWVLKSPTIHEFDSREERLHIFNEHIKIMRKYPDIFPKVKKLDKYRAAIEKVDTKTAIKQAKWLYNNILEDYGLDNESFLTDLLYNSEDYLDLLLENRFGEQNMETQLKWYNFITLIKESGIEKDIHKASDFQIKKIDFHIGNVGIDKHDTLKLIDF